ncbi:hypothetical protein ACLBWJ_13120 [Microbacterium sp. M4A5_1d]
MSAETKAALDAAIAEHIASEAENDSTLVNGYALIVAHGDAADFDDETTRYLLEYADRQSFHVSLGLVHRHRLELEQEA